MLKKIILITFCLFVIFNIHTFAGLKVSQTNEPLVQTGEQTFVPGRLVIKMAESIPQPLHGPRDYVAKSAAQDSPERLLLKKYNSQIKTIKRCSIKNYRILETKSNCDPITLAEQLKNDPVVTAVSLDYIAHITSVEPNDSFFNYQYSLHNTGQVFKPSSGSAGTAGADINAPAGWQWSTAGEQIIIAVLDSGFNPYHEDMLEKSIPGYNFVSDNYDTSDDHGHGTFVASIAAANTNNGIGIAGVAWNAKILPVKTMDSRGYGSYLRIAAGIRFAADQGAQIANLSIGGRNPSFILEDAVQYAFNKGTLIIASAGNSASAVLYPAAYDDYCLAIGASDENDQRAVWSNYGPQVDVVAPGVDIIGAKIYPSNPEDLDSYVYGFGTSYAVPIVAGAAALLLHRKSFLTNVQVMDLIKFTADDINKDVAPGFDDFIGYGRLNLETLLGPYTMVKE
ncbi:MAG: peptidase S8 [bacterium]|nr:peptidase S8 [bacterium]